MIYVVTSGEDHFVVKTLSAALVITRALLEAGKAVSVVSQPKVKK